MNLLPLPVRHFLQKWAWESYFVLWLAYAVIGIYGIRGDIPSEADQVLGFYLLHFTGSALLLFASPVIYFVAVRMVGLSFDLTACAAISLLPWVYYILGHALEPLGIPVLILITLLFWLATPVFGITSFATDTPAPRDWWRSIAAQAVAVLGIWLFGLALGSLNRVEAFRFPPRWFTQEPIIPALVVQAPKPVLMAVARTIQLEVQHELLRQGSHLLVAPAVDFRYTPTQVEFTLPCQERGFAGSIYALFSRQGDLIALQVGRPLTAVATEK